MMPLRSWCFVLLVFLCPVSGGAAEFLAGIARIDITPQHPVRLSGYAVRSNEATEVTHKIFARALALQQRGRKPSIVMTVDNCGLSKEICDRVAERIGKRTGIPRERLAFCSTHTHSAPCLDGVLPNLFAKPIPPEHLANMEKYTADLEARLERAGVEAFRDLQPAKLFWNQGTAGFARNRRPLGGPVDHSLPALLVRSPEGQVRAVWAAYACHCTTLMGNLNAVNADWMGYAADEIEKDHPGALALISAGCGADSNPFPRGRLEDARGHGGEIGVEIRRLLQLPWKPLTQEFQCRLRVIELPYDPLPDRAEWERRAKESGIVGYHARRNLERLDRGEQLPKTLPYTIQTWNFGDQLAIVFLAGEVVVDYSLRLKKELDSSRLWVSSYANGVPCYIPSERILWEGGYEAEDSLWYYDRPARLSRRTEDSICRTVRQMAPKSFQTKASGPRP